MTQADPNNPQVGDRFVNRNGYRRTIISRHGDWFWAIDDDGDPDTYGAYTIQDWKPAPPTPPDRWGVMDHDGNTFTYATREEAETVIGRDIARFTLVHYVGTVVQP